MSYISIYVSSTDSNIPFCSFIQGKNTLKTLRNNSVTQVGIVTSLKCETLKFIKCFQVHSLMCCSQASWRVGLGLLPLLYLTGKRVWEDSVICPTLHNESWNHLLVQMLLSPSYPGSVISSIIIMSWAPPILCPLPNSGPPMLHGPDHISVGGIKGKERALWYMDSWLEVGGG